MDFDFDIAVRYNLTLYRYPGELGGPVSEHCVGGLTILQLLQISGALGIIGKHGMATEVPPHVWQEMPNS
jgi:hypothetical protein